MALRRRTLHWLAIGALLPGAAAAAPQDGHVVAGEATVTREGDLTQIQTSTQQTVIHWMGGFDIGASETVNVQQPNAMSNLLNYDLSTDPTHIDGRLFSNGGVWIINPVGVFFGDQAIVDVGRLVAGAGTVDQGDFLAGVERFTGLTGNVEVAAGAQIHAAESALLVGAAVANYGNIAVADGMIALVAGGEVRLARADGRVVVTADRPVAPDPERWAIVQAGSLDAGRSSVSLTAGDAYSLAINHSGITRAHEIHAEGGDGGLVQVAGSLDASSQAAGETGGRIEVLGDQVLVGDAALDASGPAGGGEIRVGGDLRGGGALRTARRTYVSGDAQLRADALAQGDGGRIIVWADEATHFYGDLSARGAGAGGDGGFAEISGKQSLVARGAVDLGAESGDAGTLLYDPKDIVLHASPPAADGSDAPDVSDTSLSNASPGLVLFGDPDELATPFDVYESELENTNATIVLQATNSISSTDSFDVRIVDGNSLLMLTRNNTGDETGTVLPAGIHLEDVSFQTGGVGSITLATGSDGVGGGGSGASAGVEVGNLTTAGAAVSVTTEDGAIRVGSVTTAASDGTAGGLGGSVAIAAGGTGAVIVGAIDATGGDGSAGPGGDGGQVGIRTIEGVITVAQIDVSAGNGAGGGRGGNGGRISIAADLEPGSTATPPTILDPRVIRVDGDLLAIGGNGSGGTADTAALGGAGGQILVTAGQVAKGGRIEVGPSGSVQLDASAGDGTSGGGNAATGGTSAFSNATIGAIRIEAHGDVVADADLAAAGGSTTPGGSGGAAGVAGTAIVQGHGDIDVSLGGATDASTRIEVIETEATGAVDVTGAGISVQGSGAPGSTIHTITNIVTSNSAPHFTYRLADGGDGPVDLIDGVTLAVGSATFGTNGGTIANARTDPTSSGGEQLVLLGRIQGPGTGVTTAGDLALLATNIGDETPLAVSGSGGEPDLELTVAGDVDVDVSGTVGGVILTQRDAGGDAAIDLPGGGVVAIDGRVVDDGSSRVATSVVTRVDTTPGGTNFFYTVVDTNDAGSGAALRIQRGAVDLGGDGGFATPGDLHLQLPEDDENMNPQTGEAAIDAHGNSVALIAGGAISASTRGVADIANVGSPDSDPALIVLAGSSVGSADAPLRTSGASEFELVGRATTGDLRLVHSGSGAPSVGPLAIDEEGVPEGGIQVGGEVSLVSAVGGIVLRGDQPSGATAPVPNVQSGGGQRYAGSLVLASDAALVAGGDVAIEGDVTTLDTANGLSVTAAGTTELGGDVGTAAAPLELLEVSDATFTAGAHEVHVATGEFRAIDGPADLQLRGAGLNSRIAIDGNVGAQEALASFDADADLLVFGGSADRIVAGSVALNTQPPGGSTVSSVATIADTGGGLSIESAGDVAIGAGEKLSVTAALAIRAGGTATLSDLSASELSVDASRIVIQGRAPGAVAQPSGAVVTDFGVDWVANNIATNVVPEWDGVGTRPTFALGSGGIRTGGAIPFDVVRFTPDLDSIGAENFAGNDRVLDLTGIGPRVVSDASQDAVRDATPVQPWLPARFDDAPPTPPRAVSGEELLGELRCRDAAGEACPLPAPGDDPLASERARELTERYRALVGSAEGRAAVAQAFAPIARRDVPRAEAGGVDGRALARIAASGAEMEPARARIGELAVALAQVELMGLEENESELVRRAIAGEFAAATGVAGLDADAALDAVDASGVAVLP